MTALLTATLSEQFSEEVAALADRVQDSLVFIQTRGGNGSGIIWNADGLIITNHHVVPGERAQVIFRDGRTLSAMVTRRDSRRDLAVLQVEATGLTPAPAGDSTHLRVGELVVAVGHPLGLRGAATVGVVSGVGRRFGPPGSRGQAVIQADIVLAPGNSGGPLLDVAGRVMGINSMIVAPGMALAVPSHIVQDFLTGEETGAVLGIGVQEVALPPIFRGETPHQRGLLLVSIAPDGPADQAGLLPGDVLLALDGAPVDTVNDLLDWLGDHRPGVALRVEVLRGGHLQAFLVTPGRA